jgi:hypothetical protein
MPISVPQIWSSISLRISCSGIDFPIAMPLAELNVVYGFILQ